MMLILITYHLSLILSKDYSSRRQAESYIRRHKQYKPLKMDEKPKTWRYHLQVPDQTRYEYRIKSFAEGVKTIIGTPSFQMV